jgi:hypothetical protein
MDYVSENGNSEGSLMASEAQVLANRKKTRWMVALDGLPAMCVRISWHAHRPDCWVAASSAAWGWPKGLSDSPSPSPADPSTSLRAGFEAATRKCQNVFTDTSGAGCRRAGGGRGRIGFVCTNATRLRGEPMRIPDFRTLGPFWSGIVRNEANLLRFGWQAQRERCDRGYPASENDR